MLGRAPAHVGGLRSWAEHVLPALGVPAGLRVLDSGSDSGVLAEMLTARGAQVVACDPDLDAVEATALAAPRAVVLRSALETLPLLDACCDAAVSLFGLSGAADDLVAAVGEVLRVTRPGGCVALLGWLEAPHERALVDAWMEVTGTAPPLLARLLRPAPRPAGTAWTTVPGVMRFDGPRYAWVALAEQRPLGLAELPQRSRVAIRERWDHAMRPYLAADDTMRIPARAWLLQRSP